MGFTSLRDMKTRLVHHRCLGTTPCIPGRRETNRLHRGHECAPWCVCSKDRGILYWYATLSDTCMTTHALVQDRGQTPSLTTHVRTGMWCAAIFIFVVCARVRICVCGLCFVWRVCVVCTSGVCAHTVAAIGAMHSSSTHYINSINKACPL